jgi:hypothetical protein
MSGAPSDDAGQVDGANQRAPRTHAQLLETVFDVRRVSFSSKEKKKKKKFSNSQNFFFSFKSNLRAN